MLGRELVRRALRRDPVPRIPWVPFAGVHAGSLIGVPADRYLRSADHLVDGLLAARARYRADGLPVIFDLQMEAEGLGCELHWSPDGPPAVTSHPLADDPELDPARLPDFDLAAGRMPMALAATRRLRERCGEETAIYGLICGPFTLAMHLAGSGIFLAMFDRPAAVRRLVDHCAGIATRLAAAYRTAGADVIAVVDPMLSQISPEHLEEFCAPALNRIFDAVRAGGGGSCCFVCGDATRNLAALCRTHCDNISVDENVDLAALTKLAAQHGKSVGGNLRLTVALLLGTPADVERDVVRCLDAGGTTGFLLSPGCDLPYAVPPANLVAVADLVHDPYRQEVVRRTAAAAPADDFADIVLPAYGTNGTVRVDVITLDSATCPPCQYMLEAVRRAAAGLVGRIEIRERKITGREGLGFMTRLGVSHIPSICIDGVVAFSSLIPDGDRLRQVLADRIRHHAT
jgi:uroporphyrinogen decarboxylase